MDFFGALQEVWVEEAEIKVILPEGCADIQVSVPYPAEQAWTRRYTYLDTAANGGRPVLKLTARNLVPQHSRQVVISYRFSRARMLVEPLLLIAAVFAMFVVCSLVARLDDRAVLKVGGTHVKQA